MRGAVGIVLCGLLVAGCSGPYYQVGECFSWDFSDGPREWWETDDTHIYRVEEIGHHRMRVRMWAREQQRWFPDYFSRDIEWYPWIWKSWERKTECPIERAS